MKKQLMTHLYYGDPSEGFSIKLAKKLVKSGADILEIGIPYSDPVCDGEVFQSACGRALNSGTTPLDVFDGIKILRKQGILNQIFITSYFAPIFKMGVEKFIQKTAEVGAHGIIVPDILLEEQKELLLLAREYKIDVVEFATQYSSELRLKRIISAASGFIYCVSAPNVTGAKKTITKDTTLLIKRVKKVANKMKKDISIFVGFGINSPEQIKVLIKAGVDGVIVGSSIAKLYQSDLDQPLRSLPRIGEFIKVLKGVIL